jgi:hypothetical protein
LVTSWIAEVAPSFAVIILLACRSPPLSLLPAVAVVPRPPRMLDEEKQNVMIPLEIEDQL